MPSLINLTQTGLLEVGKEKMKKVLGTLSLTIYKELEVF